MGGAPRAADSRRSLRSAEVSHVKVFDREIDDCWVLFAAVLSVSHKTLRVHYDVGGEAEGKNEGAMHIPWKEEHATKASVQERLHAYPYNQLHTHWHIATPRNITQSAHTRHAAPGKYVSLGVAGNLLLFSHSIKLAEKCDEGHLRQGDEVAQQSSDDGVRRMHEHALNMRSRDS